MDTLLKCQNLRKIYPLRKNEGYAALRGVDIEISSGEFVSICGPSGCGKSTLLNILGFLDIPTDGKYFFKGRDVSLFNDSQRAWLRRKEVGFVFQSFNLLPKMSALENAMLPLLYLGESRSQSIEKASVLLEKVGLGSKKNNSILELSGGERQRVGIARALSNEPEILLADEPTGNLDSANSVEVMNMLRDFNKNMNMTVIMVTHDLKLSAMADREIRIKDGNIEK
ncbi:MAG: ABC transporter ATP-binding protein [Elusimicrobiota bacterium]